MKYKIAGILMLLAIIIVVCWFFAFNFYNEVYPLAAVVPHHDLVKTERKEFFSYLAKNFQPKTIILISPNHFYLGPSDIITTKKDWILKNGKAKLYPNNEIIDFLIKEKIASENSLVFDSEHGIKNILPDIIDFFPKAKIVPLIFKEELAISQVKSITETLVKICSSLCGVIVSVDMSHYQPALIAQIHDLKTKRALNNQDVEELSKIEVDCRSCLMFLAKWASNLGLKNFELFNHTNSGLMFQNYDVETTTHIFGYYSLKKKQNTESYLTFTFGGDVMLGRYIGFRFERNFKELFSNFGDRTFWGTDISWVNLEGPISDEIITQDPRSKSLQFLFSKKAIEALKFLKLTTVGLANNHTDDAGEKGLMITKQLLKANQIDYHGDPWAVSESSIKRYNYGDISISLIAVNVFGATKNLLDIIEQEKRNGNFVIVLPHWGNEYQTKHSKHQEELARKWIMAGADLIIGTHPHVIQDIELINGKLVFYSLGNFIFDQNFSKTVQEGILLSGVIKKEKIEIVISPFINKMFKPELLRGKRKEEILEKLCAPIKEICENGKIILWR